MTKTGRFLGSVLVILGSYSCAVVLVALTGIVISFIRMDLYGSYYHVVNPLLPTLGRAMLYAEVMGIAILLIGILRRLWRVFQSGVWRLGFAEVAFVAFVILAAHFLAFGPPS